MVCPQHIVNGRITDIAEDLLKPHNSFKPHSWGVIYLQSHKVYTIKVQEIPHTLTEQGR